MKKILIIDDQELYLKSIELVLKKKFEIILASSYSQAIERMAHNPDIALIDIRLDENDEKNIDGLKILEWVKMNDKRVSCFVMSAYQQFSYAETALNLGALHFFKKPIDVLSLIAILEEKA